MRPGLSQFTPSTVKTRRPGLPVFIRTSILKTAVIALAVLSFLPQGTVAQAAPLVGLQKRFNCYHVNTYYEAFRNLWYLGFRPRTHGPHMGVDHARNRIALIYSNMCIYARCSNPSCSEGVGDNYTPGPNELATQDTFPVVCTNANGYTGTEVAAMTFDLDLNHKFVQAMGHQQDDTSVGAFVDSNGGRWYAFYDWFHGTPLPSHSNDCGTSDGNEDLTIVHYDSNDAIQFKWRVKTGGQDRLSQNPIWGVFSNGDVLMAFQIPGGRTFNGESAPLKGGDVWLGESYIGRHPATAAGLSSPVWKFKLSSTAGTMILGIFPWTMGTMVAIGISGGNVYGTNPGASEPVILVFDEATGAVSSTYQDVAVVGQLHWTVAAVGGGRAFIAGGAKAAVGSDGHFGEWDMIICAYTAAAPSTFTRLWCRQNGSSGGVDSDPEKVEAIQYSSSRGEVIIASTIQYDYDGPEEPLIYLGNNDVLLQGLDPSTGNVVWSNIIGTTGDDKYIMGIDVADPNNQYIFISLATTGKFPLAVTNTQPTLYKGHLVRWPLCPAGQGVKVDGSGCELCPAGKFTVHLNTCRDCYVGYYSNTGASACTQCPPGFYQPLVGQSQCLPCQAGFYNPDPQGTQCFKCPTGSYSTEGSSACTQCAEGTYSDVSGASSCKQCPGGGTSETGSNKVSFCVCPEGTFGHPLQDTGCRQCPSHATCPEDTALPDADKGFWISSSEPTESHLCFPSSACPGGIDDCNSGFENTGCRECSDDTYRDGQGYCKSCRDIGKNFLYTIPYLFVVVLVIVGLTGCCITICVVRIFNGPPGEMGGRVISGIEDGADAIISLCFGTQVVALALQLPVKWPSIARAITPLLTLSLLIVTDTGCDLGDGAANQFAMAKTATMLIGATAVVLLVAITTIVICLWGTPVMACKNAQGDSEGSTQAYEKLDNPEKKPLLEHIAMLCIRLAWSAIMVLYTPLSFHAWSFLFCLGRKSGEYYMVQNSEVQCFSGGSSEWTIVTCASLAGIIFVWALVPISASAWIGVTHWCHFSIEKKPVLGHPTWKRRLAKLSTIFSGNFSPRYFFWDVARIVHKGAATAAFAAAFMGPTGVASAFYAVNFVYLLIFIRLSPILDTYELLSEVFGLYIGQVFALAAMTCEIPDRTTAGEYLLQIMLTVSVVVFYAWSGLRLIGIAIQGGSPLARLRAGEARRRRVKLKDNAADDSIKVEEDFLPKSPRKERVASSHQENAPTPESPNMDDTRVAKKQALEKEMEERKLRQEEKRKAILKKREEEEKKKQEHEAKQTAELEEYYASIAAKQDLFTGIKRSV